MKYRETLLKHQDCYEAFTLVRTLRFRLKIRMMN